MLKKLSLSIYIGFCITLATTFLSHGRVTDNSDLEKVRLGLPFHFVTQNQRGIGERWPDGSFGYQYLRLRSPWENPTSVHLGMFFLSLIFFASIIFGFLSYTHRPSNKAMQRTPKAGAADL
jgi:hypothetical protein